MQLVTIESPYAGESDMEVAINVMYAQACISDCFTRGEASFASHLLYTQPGILDDTIPQERTQGIDAGLAWKEVSDITAVYTDLGITPGMHKGIEAAARINNDEQEHELEFRTLPNDDLISFVDAARGAYPLGSGLGVKLRQILEALRERVEGKIQ